MRIFVMVFFWCGTALFVIRCVLMAAEEYPKKQKPKTLGFAVAETLLGLVVVVWAAILLWVA